MLNVLPTWKFETPQKITNSVERTNHGCQQQKNKNKFETNVQSKFKTDLQTNYHQQITR